MQLTVCGSDAALKIECLWSVWLVPKLQAAKKTVSCCVRRDSQSIDRALVREAARELLLERKYNKKGGHCILYDYIPRKNQATSSRRAESSQYG